jgi:predicted phage terminase large subunit-like protein
MSNFIEDIRNNLSKKERQLLIKTARIKLAQDSFYYYCRALFPQYYTPQATYLKTICDTLQKCYEGKIINKLTGRPFKKVILNAPPRHFKSLTISLFQSWILGKYRTKSNITACYNSVLSNKFARGVRNTITVKKPKGSTKIIYSDIFPGTKIQKGYASIGQWAVDGSHFSFLASSFGSTITGFGITGVGVIDDQINKAIDAKNDVLLADNWEWFCDTFLSRLESGAMIVVNMTRWATNDICGLIEKSNDVDNWLILKFEVRDKAGNMLNPAVFNSDAYETLKNLMSPEVFNANYHQKPLDRTGRLYKKFKTYTELPFVSPSQAKIKMIYDPSEGKGDNYCAVSYLEFDRCAYVLDILYTDIKEKATTKEVCHRIVTNGVKNIIIESNKTEMVADDILKNLKESNYDYPNVQKLFNTDSKAARIEHSAWGVQEYIFFPENWHIKYPRFYNDLIMFWGNGKDKHDDAPDVLSMIKENMCNAETFGTAYAIKLKGVDFGNYQF